MDFKNIGENENLTAHREGQSDAEKKATIALTQLRDLTHLISNHLGSPVDPEHEAKDVKINKPTSKKVDVFGVQFDDGPLGARSIPRGAAKPNAPQKISKAWPRKNNEDRDFTGNKYEKRGGDREPMEDDVGPLGRGDMEDEPSVTDSLPALSDSVKQIGAQLKTVSSLLNKLIEQENTVTVSGKKGNTPQDVDEPTKEF
tara:strand:- start:818 stop:1417 length:600 start_codon:yes stop_codon:yes gene_type:complete